MHVIIVVHGIRDPGQWMDDIQSELASDSTVIRLIRYDEDVDAYQFLFFPKKIVERSISTVSDAITNIRAEFGEESDFKLSIIAHSFGTYITVTALQRNSYVDVHKLVLCGSVLKMNGKQLQNISRQVGHRESPFCSGYLINECGTGDPWPLLANALSHRWGNAGTMGFSNSALPSRFHKSKEGAAGRHNVFLQPGFARQYWYDFLVEDKPITDEIIASTTARKHEHLSNSFVRFLTNRKVTKWLRRLKWCFFAGIGVIALLSIAIALYLLWPSSFGSAASGESDTTTTAASTAPTTNQTALNATVEVKIIRSAKTREDVLDSAARLPAIMFWDKGEQVVDYSDKRLATFVPNDFMQVSGKLSRKSYWWILLHEEGNSSTGKPSEESLFYSSSGKHLQIGINEGSFDPGKAPEFLRFSGEPGGHLMFFFASDVPVDVGKLCEQVNQLRLPPDTHVGRMGLDRHSIPGQKYGSLKEFEEEIVDLDFEAELVAWLYFSSAHQRQSPANENPAQ